MPDDVMYQSTSRYASDMATLALKMATTGAVRMLGGDAVAPSGLVESVAASHAALQRGLGVEEKDIHEGGILWKSLHGAVSRVVDDIERSRVHPKIEEMVPRIVADASIQMHSQAILDGIGDPGRAERLDLADRNVLEAVRDGGDLEDLVRRRASGSYHLLTPDQQDDVAESIRKGDKVDPEVARRIDGAVRSSIMIGVRDSEKEEKALHLPPVTRDALQRAQALSDGKARPVNEAEVGVRAHARTHPDPRDEAAIIARASILIEPERHGTALDSAILVEKARTAIQDAQQKVADGTSRDVDRSMAAGRGCREDDTPVHVEVPLVKRALLAQHVLEIQREGVTQMDVAAHLTTGRGTGRI